MPERTDIRTAKVPPPIDGIDYISPPDQIAPSKARDLLNYYIFDWGIRQTNKQVTYGTRGEAIGSLFAVDGGGVVAPTILITTTTKLYRFVPSLPFTFDLTGALAITTNNWNMNQFNKYVMMFNGTNPPIAYNAGAGTAGLAGYTGPASASSLSYGWNYKKKQYAVEKDTTNIWFGATNAITDAMTAFDVGPELQTYSPILCGSSWAYNQGLSNDELWVAIATNGEVLVYSGTDPGASNWELLGRAQIPAPVGAKCLVKLGQDILISTTRGVISLKDVFAGRSEDATYFSVSRSINPVSLANCEIAFNKNYPFLYFQNAQTGDYSTYVLNYERGAWSRIDNGYTSSNRPTAMCWLGGSGTGSNAFWYAMNDASGTLNYITDAPTDSTGVTHTWKTPFFDYGSLSKKSIKYIRSTTRNVGGTSSNITNSIAYQVMGGDVGTAQAAPTQATSDNRHYYIEAQPPDVDIGDEAPSIVFSKTGAGEINEIAGVDIFYKEGGYDG